jgi:hypothetical protein
MDYELMMIQMAQDFNELAEQYDGAASNERLWAKGASDEVTIQMHLANAEHAVEMAEMYRRMSKNPEALLNQLEEN